MKRLHSLTSLRFFAAAAVALMHGFSQNQQLPIVDLGYVGVSFFFVLSGFVLTWAGATEGGTGVFLRNRFAKLFPLNAATLAVAALVPVAVPATLNSSRLSFLQSLTLTQAWRSLSAPSFNPVTWSLSAEAFFYLLLPLLLKVMRRFNTRELIGAIVFLFTAQSAVGLTLQLTLSPWESHFLTYDFPPYRLAEFIIGIALALLLKQGYVPSHRSQLTAAALATAGVTLTLAGDVLRIAPSWVSDALMLPGVVVLIWTSARRELAGTSRLLTSPRLVRLGDRSFSFYMVHYLVLGFVGLLVGAGAQTLPWWLVPPALLAAAALAGLTYRFVEKPCERAIRDLFARRPKLYAYGTDRRPVRAAGKP